MRRALLFGVAAAALVLQGCGSTDCTSVALFGLSVRVLDANGTEVCDADVTATDGDHTETLSPTGSTQGCTYTGAVERRGTYTVTAVASGATGTAADVEVRANECHVITENVTITLAD